ncbi:efflux RND transporter periplasmic adaptor subunit [uncultured Desulfuromonas sp.]|uniref:efflux RND transporter periplasmic adaptor subunit n=1 Tax=uncultured Desulfuromonas sp. TaxID=181013 RepID=UPI00261E2F17|nr:efflux RND transporter periplasmic adaptor subunit [uncultured Desulfuromonas sp.]
MNRSLVICLFLLPAVLFACGGEIEPGRTAAERAVVTGLTLAAVAEGSLDGASSYVATIESRDRGVLAARIDGRVGRIAVREGDVVREGDLLLSLEDTAAADRLRGAEAAVAEARSGLAATQAGQRLAEQTEERFLRLRKQEAVTPQEMDRVAAEAEMARQATAVANAALQRLIALRDGARVARSHTRVRAPYDALVARCKVEEGSTVMPGTPLFHLDRQGAMVARAELPESLFGKIPGGATLRVEVPALGRVLTGTVDEVLPVADPASRSFQVKVALPVEPGLAAGFYARVLLPGEGKAMLLVADSAVVYRGQLQGVYVVEEGMLRYRMVKTGRRGDGLVEILSGLSAGETVVVSGTERARSGARVEG